MASYQQQRPVELQPTSETRHGVQVYWQIPEHPKAILFIAHGARGRPSSYWDVDGHDGVEHHKALTQYALAQGYAVISIDSVERRWNSTPESPDVANVDKILNEWRGENESLKNLRLTVLGTASGGDFVSALALKLDVFAAVLVVSHGSEEAFKAASKGSYPPTLFVHLPKEGSVGDRVKAEIKALQSKGIPSGELVSEPVPVTPTFFSDAIDGLDQELSRKLHEALASHAIIDEQGLVTKKLEPAEVGHLLHSLDLLPEDTEIAEGAPRHRGHGHGHGHGHHRGRGHRGAAAAGAGAAGEQVPLEEEEEEGAEGTTTTTLGGTEQPHRRFGHGRGHRGAPVVEGEDGQQEAGHRFGPGRRRRADAAAGGGAKGEEETADDEQEQAGTEEDEDEVDGQDVTEAGAGGPGRGRGRGGRGRHLHRGGFVGGGEGDGHGGHRHGGHHGHRLGHRGPPLKWEREIKKQLFVAEGLHGLTTSKAPQIFSWLDGSAWSA